MRSRLVLPLLLATLGLAPWLAAQNVPTPALAAPAPDESALRTEVIQTIQGMIAAEERLDAVTTWAVHADVPGYRWVDTDGTAYDFAGTRKAWTDYLAGCAKLKYTTINEDVLVLGPDLAFYTWTGSADVTPKEGPRTRNEQWTARYLCRRINGVWKIIGGQESSAPGKPVPPTTATEARAALEAYVVDFWTKRDGAALDRSMSPTVVYHYNGEVIPAAPQDHLSALRSFTGSFPDLVGTIDTFTFADGIGAAATSWTGTHKGELAGIAQTDGKPVPPTGRKVSWTVNYVFRVEGGKIVELWESWDEGGLYQKLLQPEAKPNAATPPASAGSKITFTDSPPGKRLAYAVWRTDYYICTGIAYAKSRGQTVEDFASFVGNHHGITKREAGLPKAAQLCYFVLTNYPNGKVELIAESDTSVTMRTNRAYRDTFKNGPVLGVTIEEFERCLWGHLVILFGRNGFDFAYKIEGDTVTFTVALGK